METNNGGGGGFRFARQATPAADDSKVAEVVVTEAAAEPETRAVYSSGTIRNYKVGRFQFKNGSLTLETPEDIEAFEALWNGLLPMSKNRIQKIDFEGAERVARRFLAENSMRTGIATSEDGPGTGDPAPSAESAAEPTKESSNA